MERGHVNDWTTALVEDQCQQKRKMYSCPAWWLKPVIPVLWKTNAGGSLETRSSRPAWPTWRNPVSTKNAKTISQAWWRVALISATQEAEAQESLKSGRQRLQWAEIVHSSLGNRARLFSKHTCVHTHTHSHTYMISIPHIHKCTYMYIYVY